MDIIEKVRGLSDWDKLKIYMEYFIAKTAELDDFRVVDMLDPNEKSFFEAYKTVGNIAFCKKWHNAGPLSFQDFISYKRNVQCLFDDGEDREILGYRYSGIYDWLNKKTK